jgi:hypothetical protein
MPNERHFASGLRTGLRSFLPAKSKKGWKEATLFGFE